MYNSIATTKGVKPENGKDGTYYELHNTHNNLELSDYHPFADIWLYHNWHLSINLNTG
jgi:hypothetical protein